MPGIVGLITRMPRVEAEAQLAKMLHALQHESFYSSGCWHDEELGIYAGWVARRGAFADRMPVCNETGDRWLIVSGEEYPDPSLARCLRNAGHTVRADGPDYLVHQFEEDPAFPAGLNGRFHGIAADRRRREVTLFNDRYGMHRLYHHQTNDAFYFAAEAKAILVVRPELRRMDTRSAGELIACGCVLENRTLFQNVSVLPPASVWTFVGDAIRKHSYFRPAEWENLPRLGAEEYYNDLRRVFSETLPRYFSGREAIGMSLTGGLDTRMIMAWHKATPSALPCYSFGSMFRDCQDVQIARRVAEVCGQTHRVIPVGTDFLTRFPYYAERSVYVTDGCIDVSHSADLYVNQHAASIAPVRMTGNYGGEVLRRVRAFKPTAHCPQLYSKDLLPAITTAAATYRNIVQGHPLSFALFRQAPWHHYGLLALEQTQVALRSPFLDNAFVRTVFRAPLSSCTDNAVSLRLIQDGNKTLAEIPTDRGLSARTNGFVSSAKRQLLQATAKAEYAYDYGMPQWLARVDGLLSRLRPERLFLGRHKFYHYRVWYREALSAYVREMLLDSRTLSRPYLQPATVKMVVTRHISGERNYTSDIHRLLTLELISRLFFDPQ